MIREFFKVTRSLTVVSFSKNIFYTPVKVVSVKGSFSIKLCEIFTYFVVRIFLVCFVI